MFSNVTDFTTNFEPSNRYRVLELLTETLAGATYEFELNGTTYTTNGAEQVMRYALPCDEISIKTDACCMVLYRDNITSYGPMSLATVLESVEKRVCCYFDKLGEHSVKGPVRMVTIASKVFKGLREFCVSVCKDNHIYHMTPDDFAIRFNAGALAEYSNIEVVGYYEDTTAAIGFNEGRFYINTKNETGMDNLIRDILCYLKEG